MYSAAQSRGRIAKANELQARVKDGRLSLTRAEFSVASGMDLIRYAEVAHADGFYFQAVFRDYPVDLTKEKDHA